MVKYLIENNIDFYDELNKFKNKIKENKKLTEFIIEEKKEETKEEKELSISDNICLISGSILDNNFVNLECNHKFNYIPLYKEICIQKYEFKTYNISQLNIKDKMIISKSDKDFFIKCPYCRNIQFTILPYIEELNLDKKYGINTLDIIYKTYEDIYNINYHNKINFEYIYYKNRCYKKGQCNISNELKKEKPCNNFSYHNINNYLLVSELKNTNLCFCYIHIKDGINLNKLKIKKEKEEQKEAIKKQKEEQKEAIKKQKEEQKEDNILLEKETCNYKFKSGKNKNSYCCLSKFENNIYCKRHFNMVNKNNINETKLKI